MKYLESLALAILAVFAPVKTALITALVLILVDMITGILAARKSGEAITSTGFKRTVGKIALYETAICMAFLCETYLTGATTPVCKMACAMVGLVEFKSITENLNIINGSNIFGDLISKIVQSENNK